MNQKISKRYYWYSIFSIIPIAGLVVGMLLLRKGIILKDRFLLFIGVFGILLTSGFFLGGLFYSKYSDVGKKERV